MPPQYIYGIIPLSVRLYQDNMKRMLKRGKPNTGFKKELNQRFYLCPVMMPPVFGFGEEKR